MTDQAPLVAVRKALPPGGRIDPYALAGTAGIVFDTGEQLLVGIGRALTIRMDGGLAAGGEVSHVHEALASIACDDDGLPGSAVLAFGALPFDRDEPAELVVPEVVYCRRGSDEWATMIGRSWSGDPRADVLDLVPRRHRSLTLDTASVVSSPAIVHLRSSGSEFSDAVTTALAAIRAGNLSKVVLARQIDMLWQHPVDIVELLSRWRDLEPNCTLFSIPTAAGQFVGASPEQLVARRGDRVTSRPLAGTARQGSERDDTSLQNSAKDSDEHQLVVEFIRKALSPWCSRLDVPDRPELVHLRNVVHLGTAIRGALRPDATGIVPSVLELVALLHPTPAVGGVPRAVALDLIGRLESSPRGNYAGPVGYIDARGDGEWMVGIRAATLRGRSACLAAGVGIVEGSEPAAELAETELKFAAVLSALAPEMIGSLETRSSVA